MKAILMMALLSHASAASMAQIPVQLTVDGKLRYHAAQSFGPAALASSGLRAGFLQLTDSPSEWGQGAAGYERRFGSSVATAGVRGVLAFTLDSALHQDPRYHRSLRTGVGRRAVHTLRCTILTRKDGGGETLAVWRLGSAYGSAFIANQWQPDRTKIVGRGLAGGSVQIGLDFGRNLGAEFWPDIKRILAHRKP